MRYRSINDKLVLFKTTGELAHQFEQGILIVGDPVTHGPAANVINGDVLMHLFDTDLDGGTAHTLEHVGLGSLTGLDYGGVSLSPTHLGFRGFFFEAPPFDPPSGATVLTGQRWEVTQGDVTYGGVAYSKGDIVETTYGTNFVDVLNGAVALYLPLDLVNACNAFRDEEYKIKNLKVGDEALNYWNWATGYTSRAGVTDTNADFFGWVRT